MSETALSKRPTILVSNDDGITAKGIRTLVEIMSELGRVVVVAPDSPQSGMGHAITIHSPLKVRRSSIFEGIEAYEVSGTPADCVKLAKFHLFPDQTPDLVVSGINHGSNTSISVLYSGTMSAAIEGAIEGLPSIGYSLCNYSDEADFSHVRSHVKFIAQQVLEKGLAKFTALNVNFPAQRENQPIKGVRICRQARAKWQEKFDERTDPYGRKYLWLAGDFVNHDRGEDTDEWAIANNYTSVVPCSFDMTAHHLIGRINDEWDLEKAPLF